MRQVAAALALLALSTIGTPAVAQSLPMYEVNVRGVPMTCTAWTGQTAAVVLDTRLPDVGMATWTARGEPVIIINPDVTNQYSDIVAQWWFAHECAHLALAPADNSEINADCFGVKQLVAVGLLDTEDELAAFHRELSDLPGSSNGHLPGPQRAHNITQCALY